MLCGSSVGCSESRLLPAILVPLTYSSSTHSLPSWSPLPAFLVPIACSSGALVSLMLVARPPSAPCLPSLCCLLCWSPLPAFLVPLTYPSGAPCLFLWCHVLAFFVPLACCPGAPCFLSWCTYVCYVVSLACPSGALFLPFCVRQNMVPPATKGN